MSDTLRWLLSLLRPYRWQMLAGSVLVALTVLGNVGLLATSGLLLSKAAVTPEVLLLMPLITGVRFFGIGRALMRYVERLLNHSVAFRILGHLRKDFYDHLEPLVPDALPRYSEGKLYNQFIGDINVLQFFYLKAVSVPLGSVIIYTVCALFLAFFAPSLIPLLLLGQILAGVVVPVWVLRRGKDTKVKAQASQTALSEAFLDYKQGLTDLHLFGKLKEVQGRLHDLSQCMTYLHYKMSLKKRLVSRTVFALSHLFMLAALWALIPAVQSGAVAGVEVAMLALLVLGSFEAILQMPEAVLQMDESLAAAKDMHAVYETAPYEKPPQQNAAPKGFDVRLAHVDFHYHQVGRRFIEDWSLTIPSGQHVAVVGASGSGKSSLAHLISGLWQPDSGSLWLGDCPYTALSEAALHRHIACVTQDNYFFYTSLRENMQLANPAVTDEAIWQALEAVELKDMVEGLPQGLETVLAENAAMLSGGQRQRLAIARLLIQTPDVVILDEPLQKLDKGLAERIFARLLEWGREKTMIVISHSLAGLEVLDFTYVISYGRIIEQGSPKRLMAKNGGHYRALYDIEQGQF